MTGHGKPRVGAVVVAAGSGQRFGGSDKVLADLAGRPLVAHSIEVLADHPRIDEVVVLAGTHTLDRVRNIVAAMNCPDILVCRGGETRSDSVRNGLRALSPSVVLVAVHDAARPLVRADLVSRTIEAAERDGAAVPVTSVTDTLYRVGDDGVVESVENRDQLRGAQTPQVARRDWLDFALSEMTADTDEGGVLLRRGYSVATVEGCPENMKVTWPSDLVIAEAILAERRR